MLIRQQRQEKVLFLSISVIVFSVFLIVGKLDIGTVVAQQQGRINWGEVCRTPQIDALITEPCEYLITPDGYNLTPEGQRILACTVAEGAGSILFPELSPLIKSMGIAVGCDSETTGLGTSGPTSSFPSKGPPTTQPACGNTVTGNVTLISNLNCQVDGLIVGDVGTTINLNGFGIYGPGAETDKIGIYVSDGIVTINGPGIISGFQAGILAQEASELVVTSLILQNNQIAAFFTGADMTSVQENIIKNNNIGVASDSASGLNIENDLMDGNALAGVTFVNTDESAISSNTIQGSQNAIFLDEQSTTNIVQLNNAHDNVVDINNANGLSATSNQNTFSDNNCLVSDPTGLCSATVSQELTESMEGAWCEDPNNDGICDITHLPNGTSFVEQIPGQSLADNATESQMPAGWMGWVNATTIAGNTTQQNTTQQITPQNQSAAKVLINDAIRDLQSNDISAALTHLNLAIQELDTYVDASTNTTGVLVNDAIRDLQSNDTNAALTHLNLAIQHTNNEMKMDTSQQQHFTKYDFMNTYNLSIGNDIFSIRYNLSGGNLLGIDLDKKHPPALNVNTSYTDNKLTIEIPRALLDSKDSTGKDDDFVVWYVEGNRELYADKYSRILEIDTFGDTQIVGTTSSYSNPKE